MQRSFVLLPLPFLPSQFFKLTLTRTPNPTRSMSAVFGNYKKNVFVSKTPFNDEHIIIMITSMSANLASCQ